jgi:hypothetical protein
MVLLGAEGGALACVADTELAGRAVELELGLGEGPCHLAGISGDEVVVEDLVGNARFPVYAVAALAQGVRGVTAVPLRLGRARLGAVAVVGRHTGSLGETQLSLLRTGVQVAAALVSAASGSEVTSGAVDEELFSHHAVVHQAVGMLAEQLGCTPLDAMARLRAAAVAAGSTLEELAASVVSGQTRLDV